MPRPYESSETAAAGRDVLTRIRSTFRAHASVGVEPCALCRDGLPTSYRGPTVEIRTCLACGRRSVRAGVS